jgi:hypothetical protein
MRAPHVNGAILIGEPMDEPVAERVLRNECAAGRSTENEDVHPTGVIRD